MGNDAGIGQCLLGRCLRRQIRAQAAALPAAELRAHVAAALKGLRAEGGGSSQAPGRALLLSEPPSVDAGEITDKGYINQRAVLKRRDALVRSLYAGGPDVIVVR